MSQRVCLRLFVGAMVLIAAELVHVEGSPPVPPIAVRVYDGFGVGTEDMTAALGVADDIFRDAGFVVAWRMCNLPSSGAPADPCGDIVRPAELLVRIAAAPAQTAGGVLGYSFVDPQAQKGTLSTVLANRVKEQAARARIRFAILLGRTIAHEVGHLLLGTGDHSPTGLMQARWSDEQLRRGLTHDGRFSAIDAARMSAMLSARQTSAVMATLAVRETR